MKVAICFSGQFQRVQDSIELLKQQINRYTGYSQLDLIFSHWGNNTDTDSSSKFLDTHFPNCNIYFEFTKNYKWSSRYEHADCWSGGNTPEAMFMQAGGIKNCDRFRQSIEQQNNFKYDIVIRSRADIDINSDIDLRHCDSLLTASPDLVLFPANWHFKHWWNNQDYVTRHPGRNVTVAQVGQKMLCDQWFAARSNVMSKITTYVDHINEYADAGSRFHPETLLWWHIENSLKCPFSFQSFRIKLRGIDED